MCSFTFCFWPTSCEQQQCYGHQPRNLILKDRESPSDHLSAEVCILEVSTELKRSATMIAAAKNFRIADTVTLDTVTLDTVTLCPFLFFFLFFLDRAASMHIRKERHFPAYCATTVLQSPTDCLVRPLHLRFVIRLSRTPDRCYDFTLDYVRTPLRTSRKSFRNAR